MQDTDVNTNTVATSSSDSEECVVVEEEVNTPTVGKYVGQCKWFNDLLGYGFVTVCDGNDKGKDIFVHHSGIMPLNSNYRTLKKGEYLNFNIIDGMNGLQAVDVTGISGGPLMCDFVSVTRTNVTPQPNQNQSTYVPRHTHTPSRSTTGNASVTPVSPHSRQVSQQTNNPYQAISNALGSQWYVVTKTGRKKNLAKYSKEGRALMKQAKQGVMQQLNSQQDK